MIDCLALLTELVQLGMKFEVDLGKDTSVDDLRMICQMSPKMRCSLPSEISEELMSTTEQPIPLAEVVMLLFCDLESVNAFTGGRDVEYTGVDHVWDGVAEVFTKHQSVTTLVKELHHVCRDSMSGSFSMTCPECEQVNEER